VTNCLLANRVPRFVCRRQSLLPSARSNKPITDEGASVAQRLSRTTLLLAAAAAADVSFLTSQRASSILHAFHAALTFVAATGNSARFALRSTALAYNDEKST